MDWFTLFEKKLPYLWCLPPVAIETVVEVFNDDRLVHPNIPDVFCVSRLMTHLWRKALSNDGDLLFTVAVGNLFWPKCMYEPLFILVVLPLFFVPHYSWPWVLQGSALSNKYKTELNVSSESSARNGPQEFHDVAAPCLMCGTLVSNATKIFCKTILLKQEYLLCVWGRDAGDVTNCIREIHSWYKER